MSLIDYLKQTNPQMAGLVGQPNTPQLAGQAVTATAPSLPMTRPMQTAATNQTGMFQGAPVEQVDPTKLFQAAQATPQVPQMPQGVQMPRPEASFMLPSGEQRTIMSNESVSSAFGRQPTPMAPTMPQVSAPISADAFSPRATEANLNMAIQGQQAFDKASAEREARANLSVRPGVDVPTLAAQREAQPTAEEQKAQLEMQRLKQIISQGNSPNATTFQAKRAEFEERMQALSEEGVSPEEIAARRRAFLAGDKFDPLMFGGEGNSTEATPSDGGSTPPASTPTINSQAEYDALPAGAEYIDSQGNKGIKR